MRLLILGGTAWLGGYVAATAVEQGHAVTCLARGESGSVPDGADLVRADRDGPEAYDAVRGVAWDAVVDVSRQPGHVRRAVEELADRSGFYVFVSSGNVYADHSTPGADETAALLPPLAGDVMEDMESYGEAKVACETAVTEAFGVDRATIVRAGLIGGPGDIFGRTGYWPLRFAHPAAADGRVLVPDSPDLPTQVIDVRDLAAWIVSVAGRRTSGVFNATGETVPFSRHIDVAREVAGHTGPLALADPAWLSDHEVAPWMGERSLPIWLPMADYAGFNSRDGSAARHAGLTTRSLDETLADALAWEIEMGADRPRKSGLTADQERELLGLLNQL